MQELLNILPDMFRDLETFLRTYGYFAIFLLTFLEGETIVVLAGIAAAQGLMNPLFVVIAGFTGSFLGDQLYYIIGQRYGQILLERWPHLKPKAERAFQLVRRYQDLYILSFRFIYGIRNISPFVIAISGVTRIRFVLLNATAALLWAITFTSGGYFFGHAMEHLIEEYHVQVLLWVVILAAAVVVLVGVHWQLKQRRQMTAVPHDHISPSDRIS